MELKTNYKTIENKEKNGIELYFDSIPTYQERQQLKENGYKWHNQKQCWYIRKDLVTNELNKIDITNTKVTPKHNLKVGDILLSSWGYEQTNNSFFRVEELKGQTMVRVREVILPIIHEESEGISPMSADFKYDVNKFDYVTDSIFIKDNENGVCKKVHNYNQDKSSGDFVIIDNYAYAHKYNGEATYCSWYY